SRKSIQRAAVEQNINMISIQQNLLYELKLYPERDISHRCFVSQPLAKWTVLESEQIPQGPVQQSHHSFHLRGVFNQVWSFMDPVSKKFLWLSMMIFLYGA
ncbi:hypothetical protein SK128_003156, partial [Halocaridina rubra]